MRASWLAFLLVAALVPGATAQAMADACVLECAPPQGLVRSTDPDPSALVVLYGHMSDPFLGALLTTQRPSPELDPPIDHGFLNPRLQTGTGTPADFNLGADVRLVPNGARLDVVDGRVRGIHEPALQGLKLGTGTPFLVAYVSVDETQSIDADLGVAPRVTFEATWVTSGVNGQTLAHGSAGPFDLSGLPGREPLYEIRIPLHGRMMEIPGPTASYRSEFNVRALQVDSSGAEFAQAGIRIRSDVDHPWRVILPTRNAVETLAAETLRTRAGVHHEWQVGSPFGPYDVDTDTAVLQIHWANGTMEERSPSRVKHSYDHHGHQPIKLLWSFEDRELEELNVAHLEARVRNQQGTFELVETVHVEKEPLQPVQTPGVGAVVGLLALVGLALGRRRRA